MTAADGTDEFPDGPGIGDGAGDELTDAALRRVVDEGRASDAAAERSRQRWLQQQAIESARLSGVLSQAAEWGSEVTLRVDGGTEVAGEVHGLGTDVVVLRGRGGRRTYVAAAAVRSVRVGRLLRSDVAADDRAGADILLSELLADAVEERPRVSVSTLGDPNPVVGDLVAVGADVLTLQQGAGVAYVPVAAVAALSFLDGAA